MNGDFVKISEALFHLAQLYECCTTREFFKEDPLYGDVLLELADKLLGELYKLRNK